MRHRAKRQGARGESQPRCPLGRCAPKPGAGCGPCRPGCSLEARRVRASPRPRAPPRESPFPGEFQRPPGPQRQLRRTGEGKRSSLAAPAGDAQAAAEDQAQPAVCPEAAPSPAAAGDAAAPARLLPSAGSGAGREGWERHAGPSGGTEGPGSRRAAGSTRRPAESRCEHRPGCRAPPAGIPTGASHWYPPNQGRARRALPSVGTGESFGARLVSTHWSFSATFSPSLQEKARELKDSATRRSKTAREHPRRSERASDTPVRGP